MKQVGEICTYKNGDKVMIEEVYRIVDSKGETVSVQYDIVFLGTLVKSYSIPEGWIN